jgi:hypothetical protein
VAVFFLFDYIKEPLFLLKTTKIGLIKSVADQHWNKIKPSSKRYLLNALGCTKPVLGVASFSKR